MTRAIAFLAALLLVGCAPTGAAPHGTAPTPTNNPSPSAPPSPAASPTLPPVTGVGSAAQAAAVVFASQGISRMGPRQPDAIGQSAWYEASEDATGYSVTITAGAGDCQAGCIDQHTWTYHVDHDGTVAIVSDEGDDIGLPTATGTADPVTLRIVLTSGPTCPVVRDPPDRACAARPVANVEIGVFDVGGTQVADGLSGVDGTASVQLPRGAYFVVAAQVEGLMGQAGPLAFAAVGGDTVALSFTFDTGIR
ncbi:MAG: hypothetical protein ABI744_08255 [Chloroflexota bacterium]